MGQQKGPLRLRGTHGDFTFAETKDGYVWRKKAIVDKNRLALKTMERVRNNIAEFSTAGRAVKLIREAFKTQISIAKDRHLTPRLQVAVVKVVQGDTVHPHGLRTAATGDPALLEQFQCNPKALFSTVLGTDHSSSIDRATGNAILTVPPFIPDNCLVKPDGSTHFRISASCSEIDFENNSFETKMEQTALLPIDRLATAAIVLTNTMTPGSTLPVFLAAGIQFSQVVNGFETPIVGGDSCALCFVKVDNP